MELPKCHPVSLFTLYHLHGRLSLSLLFSLSLNTLLFLLLDAAPSLWRHPLLLTGPVISTHFFFTKIYVLITEFLVWITQLSLALSHSRSHRPAYRMDISLIKELDTVRPFPWVNQTKNPAPFTSVWLHRNRNKSIHEWVRCWNAKQWYCSFAMRQT